MSNDHTPNVFAWPHDDQEIHFGIMTGYGKLTLAIYKHGRVETIQQVLAMTTTQHCNEIANMFVLIGVFLHNIKVQGYSNIPAVLLTALQDAERLHEQAEKRMAK